MLMPCGPIHAADKDNERSLIEAAVAGDQTALERLLLTHYDDLERHIRSQLWPKLQSVHAVEDILQLTFIHAFRDIRGFEPRSDTSFASWLCQIAEHRLIDTRREHDRQKRGGGMRQIEDRAADDSQLAGLWDSIAASDPTASSLAARGEAIHALQVALATLPADQHEAIRLRHFEGKSLDETAAAMARTPDAIRCLIHRGKEALQEALGRASKWLKTN